ncbi:MAG TPA: NAD(P)/FAD-dependent oxidoreductase [Thermoanaerobaculia bacterium]|nr:NAD(P)/FAD-dependent oxidoreductase [Thermoanaerobaculia bacterium]
MEVDVAIVGAGPAGSTLAALLARRGASVALIDRDLFPRDKLCGEFLSYDALPILEKFAIDLADAPRIHRCRVVGRHRTYEFEFPHAARGVSRRLLDDVLLRNARAAGAQTLEGCTAVSVSPNGVQTDADEIRARAVVGAWGRWGRFDQQLRRSFVRDHAHRNFGFKRHYRGVPPRGIDDAIELYSFDRGYLGVARIENGITNICGIVHETRLAGHKGRWDSFVDEIRRNEPRLEQMYSRYQPAQDTFLSSEPVIFRGRSAVEQGIFLIGDASGVIDPLTGNGMAMAIQSALLAAPHVLDGQTEKYRQRHHEFFASRIRWSRRVAFVLSRPALIDTALGAHRLGRYLLRRTRADRDEVARLADIEFGQ